MKQRVKISAVEPDQIPSIAQIARLSFSDPWSETVFRKTLAQENSQIWCATENEMVCAYLVLSRTGDEMSVEDIAVHPAYRGRGIGRLLLEQAHTQHLACDFWLEVRESNTAALQMYRSLGYIQVGFRKRYYRNPEEGAVLMTRIADGTIAETDKK